MNDLKIIADFGEVIAVDKPAGWLSIPGRGHQEKCSVVSTELGKLLRQGEERKSQKDLFILHRLDQGTSGVMLFSKTAESHRSLSQQFLEGKIKKTYWALVSGVFPEQERTIDAPLFKLPGKKNKSIIDSKGKPSQTVFKLLNTNGEFSLIEARPLTGRSHQIRVHLQHLGFPLLGDKLYGGPLLIANRPVDGALLHASAISFKWPETVTNLASASPRGDFLEVMNRLG